MFLLTGKPGTRMVVWLSGGNLMNVKMFNYLHICEVSHYYHLEQEESKQK